MTSQSWSYGQNEREARHSGSAVNGSAFPAQALAWAGHYNKKLVSAVRARKKKNRLMPLLIMLPAPGEPGVTNVFMVSKVYRNMVYLQELERHEYVFEFKDGDGDLASQTGANLFAQLYVSGAGGGAKIPLKLCDCNFYNGTAEAPEELFTLDSTLVVALPQEKKGRRRGRDSETGEAGAALAVEDGGQGGGAE